MNVFDKYLIGEIDDIEWCFETTHFNKRLNDNHINIKYIKELIEEEPLRHDQEQNHTYFVYYPAPSTKDYDEIKLVFKCHDNTINVITVMPATEKFKSQEYKEKKKMRDRAYSKVNRNFR